MGNCGKVNGENPASGQVEEKKKNKLCSTLCKCQVKRCQEAPPLVKTHSKIAVDMRFLRSAKSYSGEHAGQALVHSPLSS